MTDDYSRGFKLRILDRYLLKEFLKYFFGAMVALLVIIIVSEIFELMDVMINNKVHFLIAGAYFFYQLPYWITQVSPVACLMGILFSLGNLVRSNELTAMKASGLNLYRIIAPILFFAFFISILFIVLNETIVPYTTQKAQYYRFQGIYLRPPDSKVSREDVTLYGSNRQIYKMRVFDGQDNSMKEVFIDKFRKDATLESRLYAKKAIWENGQWLFYDGIWREFDSTGKNITKTEKFEQKFIFTGEIPQDFAKSEKIPSEMNMQELKERIKKLENNGLSSHQEKVDLYMKIAFPFANFIILLLGIPFALSGTHGKKVIGIGTAILISFAYWGLLQVSRSLGSNNILGPWIAAWIVNIIFFIIASVLIIKIKK
jgi:lipopolysaccharide export system permease protein